MSYQVYPVWTLSHSCGQSTGRFSAKSDSETFSGFLRCRSGSGPLAREDATNPSTLSYSGARFFTTNSCRRSRGCSGCRSGWSETGSAKKGSCTVGSSGRCTTAGSLDSRGADSRHPANSLDGDFSGAVSSAAGFSAEGSGDSSGSRSRLEQSPETVLNTDDQKAPVIRNSSTLPVSV